MGEQSVDVRSTLAILRRNRRTLAGAAALGVAAGALFVMLWPPMYTSTSQVLLPPPTQDSSGQTVSRDVETQVAIARSDAVLGRAVDRLQPPMTVRQLLKRLSVSADTDEVLVIEASATTQGRAERIAQAVAASVVGYTADAASSLTSAQQTAMAARRKDLQTSLDAVNAEIKKTSDRKQQESPASVEGKADAAALAQLTAQQASLVLQIDQIKDKASTTRPGGSASIIQNASPARRSSLASRYLLFGVLGLVGAVLLAATLLVLFARRDRRLRFRDEIADAVGSAVIASVRSASARAVAGWTALLESYAPGTVDAWALRQAVRQLPVVGLTFGPRHEERGDGEREPASLLVVTLSDDVPALAMAPQIASYAAASGVRSRLVAAQRHESADALWAACSNVRGDTEIRPGLRVSTRADQQQDVDLTVTMAVVDRDRPELAGLPPTSATVLAVSSGSATAEDLARVAVTVDDAGRRIDGVVVADPDNLDRTTGRLLQPERSQQVPLPTRLTGLPSKPGAPGTISGLRRRPG